MFLIRQTREAEMDSNQLNRNVCRICLSDNVWLDWNTPMYQFYNTTYKDCYYKYSQLENYASDTFPQMLCRNCSKALSSTHVLILKALESHKILQDKFNELRTSTSLVEDGNYSPEFVVEKIEIEPVVYSPSKFDESCVEDFIVASVEPDKQKGSVRVSEKVKTEAKTARSLKEHKKDPLNSSLEINASLAKITCSSRIKSEKIVEDDKYKIIEEEQITEKERSMPGEASDHDVTKYNEKIDEDESAVVESNVKKKCKEWEIPRMCSLCSKVLRNKYAVQKHEKAHSENRQRTETCKVCGLKFYDRKTIYSHMLIHKENREKKHKCEFCSKAFYNKGGLNIHRRIHLGQMVSCTLCSKQYFRQIDLDRHMVSHSAVAINSDIKQRSRCYVRCKHCDKNIRSTSFKSHTAAHLNEPLMKCTICGKEYFRRTSCVKHVKRVHKKTNEEYNDFIETYKKDRISRLFLEQTTDIQLDE